MGLMTDDASEDDVAILMRRQEVFQMQRVFHRRPAPEEPARTARQGATHVTIPDALDG